MRGAEIDNRKEVGAMSRDEMRETLEKQLQLLSERSAGTKDRDYIELAELTKSMCLLTRTINQLFPYCQ